MQKILHLLVFVMVCNVVFAQSLEEQLAIEHVAKNAYERMATPRRICHIAVKCDKDATQAEVDEAYKKISHARMRVVTGNENFKSVALETSDDINVSKTRGDLGWVQVFKFVKAIEDATYKTPIGQVSEIVRSPFGFHILLVEEEEEYQEVNVRHIMIRMEHQNEMLIDSLYHVLLQTPEKFENLAKLYSWDSGSNKRGGSLGWIARGTLVQEFEDQAFSLPIGTISRPFTTPFGWHIVQVLERRKLSPYEDIKENLFNQIQKDQGYMSEVNNLIASGFLTPKETLTNFALLEIVNNDISFKETSNDNVIDANESGSIVFKVRNVGKGIANDCYVKINIKGTQDGIIINKQQKIVSIPPSESVDINVPFSTNYLTIDGNVIFNIEVIEPNGFGTSPLELSVATRAFVSPFLQVVDYVVTGDEGETLVKRKPFNLQLMLQNTRHGNAEEVEVAINLPTNVFLIDGKQKTTYQSIAGGDVKTIDYQLIVNNNYVDSIVPVEIKLKEKYGKYAENKNILLQLNQALTGIKLNVQSTEKESHVEDIQLATIGSIVDKDIPICNYQNENTLVLIVSNEHYQSMPIVPYAINDGNVFKEYCAKTLGILPENIMYQADATLNGIRQKVVLLQKKVQARHNAGKDTRVILYYTGHGMPDINTQSAYLMPVDGFDEDISTGYKLDDLYQQLGQMPATSVIVFLDACFSGVNRNDKALAVHKGARLTTKNGSPIGNMVVFAASQGNQTASVYDSEGHGLFTYFLLKKLKATQGDVSLSELAEYLTAEVNIKSLDIFEKEQTPSVVSAPLIEHQWQNWKLK